MTWLEKFNTDHIRDFCNTLTPTQKMVFGEFFRQNVKTANLKIKKDGEYMKASNLARHMSDIKSNMNKYIEEKLLDETEKSEWQNHRNLNATNAREPASMVSSLYLLSRKYGDNIIAFCKQTNCEDEENARENELHDIIKSKLTLPEKIYYLQQILNANPERINEENDEGCTPLFTAVATNQLEIAEVLLVQKNIEIDRPNYYRWTPFLKAANMGLLEIAKMLVNHGAKKDSTTLMNANAVYEAAYGCDSLNMVKYLVEDLELDINISTTDQFTPLLTAIWRQNYEIAGYLIRSEKLKSINSRDLQDENALYKAISYGHFNLAHLLFEKNAEFYRPNPLSSQKFPQINPKMRAFFDAVEGNNFDTAKMLIDSEENESAKEEMVNQQKRPYQRSILSIAAEKGNKQLVELLVENKASLFACNNHGRTPKEMVLKKAYPKVYEYLDQQEQMLETNPSEAELRSRYG